MKTKFIIIIGLIILTVSDISAQSRTKRANIKVFGNCGMCKNRIEAALEQPGIKFAEWNVESKALDVVYNEKKISEKQIHEIIAAIGHDTEQVKAKDEVYAKLPFCCLYRDHDHSNIKDEPHNH